MDKIDRPAFAGLRSAFQAIGLVVRALLRSKLGLALPLLVVLLLLAAVLSVLAMFPALAPFVYPLF